MITSSTSLERGRFWSIKTYITIMAVIMPSPVVAYLLKMIWPDCSPPR